MPTCASMARVPVVRGREWYSKPCDYCCPRRLSCQYAKICSVVDYFDWYRQRKYTVDESWLFWFGDSPLGQTLANNLKRFMAVDSSVKRTTLCLGCTGYAV